MFLFLKIRNEKYNINAKINENAIKLKVILLNLNESINIHNSKNIKPNGTNIKPTKRKKLINNFFINFDNSFLMILILLSPI